MKKLVSLTRALTFGMAVLSMPTLALAQAISVQVGDTGEHTGAGVVVPVTVACVDNSRGADLEVGLFQSRAGGEGDLDLAEECGSTPHTVHVLVRLDPKSPSSFRVEERGFNDANADLDACDASGRNCNRLSNSRNIDFVL